MCLITHLGSMCSLDVRQDLDGRTKKFHGGIAAVESGKTMLPDHALLSMCAMY